MKWVAVGLLALSSMRLEELVQLPAQPVENAQDLCRVPQNPDDVTRYLAGERVRFETLSPRGRWKDPPPVIGLREGAYNVTLVPVGYRTTRPVRALARFLNEAFSPIAVHFSYFQRPVPLGLQRVGRLALIDPREDMDRLREDTDSIAVVYNARKYLGSGGRYPSAAIFAGGNPHRLYLATHELGHHFGLGDGYFGFYNRQRIEEYGGLFLPSTKLKPWILEAYRKVQPQPRFTGWQCDGEPVFTFTPADNVMHRKMTDEEIRTRVRDGTLFTEFQTEIMRSYLRHLRKE